MSLLLLVTACGGGGGGGSTPPAAPPSAPTPTLSLFAGNMGGSGNADGTAGAARFSGTYGLATDSNGNVYVADSGSYTIRKITPAGVVTTLAGSAGVLGSSDGSGAVASFANPLGVAADRSGNVYVADSDNYTVRKISPAGVVTTLAGLAGTPGNTDGPAAAARFNYPQWVAVDTSGNVYVVDDSVVRKISAAGVVTTLADLNGAAGIAADSNGNLYAAVGTTIQKLSATGVVTTLAGSATYGSADGVGAAASFMLPFGITTDNGGNVYVTDNSGFTIRKITPAGVVTTLAGGSAGTADGSGAAAQFDGPVGIAMDASNNLYVADYLTIRKVTQAGVVTTIAGAADKTGSTDGTGAAALFNAPARIAVDGSGSLFVGDNGNATIRKITATGVVTTFAGTAGAHGHVDATGAAARFGALGGFAFDSNGNLFATDPTNNTIRKITPAGVVTTVAGSVGMNGSVDATGSAATFNGPTGITVDHSGNLLVTDRYNSTVRKISPSGVATTLAGTAGQIGSLDATGTSARFGYPTGITTDSGGNVFVADPGYHAIRKINSAGVVTTFAGTSGLPGSADGAGAAARFNQPFDIASDSSDNLYVADSGNSTIRKITPGGVVTTVVGVAKVAGFTPGALPGVISYPVSVAVHGKTLYFTMNNGVAMVQNLP
jgi:hypothetical protein